MQRSSDFRKTNYHVWAELNNLFNENKRRFPCLFAISSFNKGQMWVRAIDDMSLFFDAIAEDLIKLSETAPSELNETEKSLTTYVAVVNNKSSSSPASETEFLTHTLQSLRGLDPKEWPEKRTKNTNDPEFEFYFNNKIWFPVFLSPWHRSLIRQAPYIAIAFQPGSTFDHNKSKTPDRYERMRKSIHSRIDCFYMNDRPYYLSQKSSGKNICQYIGYDETENNPNFSFPRLP